MFKFIKKFKYNREQKKIDKEFKKEGLTAKVLQKQIDLNKKRHENNIPDPSEVIYTDEEGKEFVQ